jgi:hypothetical protein
MTGPLCWHLPYNREKNTEKHVRVAGECQLAKNIQNRAYLPFRIHKHNNKNIYICVCVCVCVRARVYARARARAGIPRLKFLHISYIFERSYTFIAYF